jgi:hypothetical protein
MDIPGSVNVVHVDGKTWLCDGFVLLDATGSSVVQGLDEGLYRLQLRNGFVFRDRHIYKLPAYMTKVHRYEWYPAYPTRWAPYPSKAKARLFFVEVPTWDYPNGYIRFPLMLNEEIWKAILDRHSDARFWHPGFEGPFKVTTPANDELAYIEPVTIPEDLQREAIALMDVTQWKGHDDTAEDS